MATGSTLKPVEIGIFAPDMRPTDKLTAGEVGYIATGLKTVRECRVGDTITLAAGKPANRCPATAKPSRWYLPVSTRSRAKITRT